MMNDTAGDAIDVDQELYPALIQCFFIISAGYIAGQLNLLTSTQSIGLSRFISNFALPAVIFKNLVDIQFQSVSWEFLGSVFIAKAIVFLCTALIAGLGERPRNFASLGLYAIMTSQSNDFALMSPIIDAVYKQSHPDYQRYLYLVAPISLVILNPIGLFLIEIQKRLDDRHGHPNASRWSRCQLIKNILLNICRNPVVICTLLGVIFNRIFHEHLPNILEHILTPISQAFSATALFYLGLTMVGKLRQFHTNLVITVLLLSLMKLVIFPLILRQAVYLLIKPTNGSLNNTIDYSNFGFLYGTAPTAPSILFYVPDSNTALQAVASTGLVLCTLLAGPIMLISAKMINLRTLDTNVAQAYEASINKTAYDLSIISLFCTLIVLIGFVLRRHLIRTSFIHKYTFLFVGIQMIHAIWTISVQFIVLPISDTDAIVVSLGRSLITLTTRTWPTSLAIALMISVCYSSDRARKYFWVYHLFGWCVPICATLFIYLISENDKSKDQPIASSLNFKKTVVSVSIFVLALCIVVSSISLIRISRRIYRLKHKAQENRHENSLPVNETRPLLNDESEIDQSYRTIPPIPSTPKPFEGNTQLLRHAFLVGIMNINAFVCIAVLSWSILVKNRDGIYYELDFFDVVLLHGQGLVTFLIFALDADLLLPISRKIVQLLNFFGLKIRWPRENNNRRCSNNDRTLNFETKIRPDFVRHSVSTQSTNSSTSTVEPIFNGNDFCQWLVSNGHMDNESKAQQYCRELENKKQIVCVNRTDDGDLNDHWYAFSK